MVVTVLSTKKKVFANVLSTKEKVFANVHDDDNRVGHSVWRHLTDESSIWGNKISILGNKKK